MYDKNKDGLIDRYEARLFVVNEAGGPALRLGAIDGALTRAPCRTGPSSMPTRTASFRPSSSTPSLRKLLKHDTNDDEAISLAELNGAARGQR